MSKITNYFKNFSYLSVIIGFSNAYATQTSVSSDASVSGSIQFNDLLTSANFTSQGLILTNPADTLSLGYTSLATSALASTDLFTLTHSSGKRLTLNIDVPIASQTNIAVPIVISTADEELNFIVNSGASLTINGAITGGGVLKKSGLGSMTLPSLSNLTGQLQVTQGTVVATASASQLQAMVQVASGSSLSLALSGTPTSPLIATDGDLTLYTASSVSLDSTIIGQGTLTKTGAGTLSLTGFTSYTGGTTVSSGRLILGHTSLQGPIVNNAQLEWSLDQDSIFTNSISGTGTFYKSGSAELYLNSTLTSTGDFFVQAGQLRLGDNAFLQNNINVSAGAQLDLDLATAHQYAGTISGDGSLLKEGVGSLSLSGPAEYADFHIVQGQVTLNEQSLSGDITHDSDLILNITTGPFSYTGNFSGTGSLTKQGIGSMSFNNSFEQTGLFTIQSGQVQVADGFTLGNVVNSGTLAFALSDRNEYAGSISGTGNILKSGSGELLFYSPQSYTGSATVSAGTLTVYDTALNSDYNVAATLNIVAETQDLTYSSTIAGTGQINKRGNYNLHLAQPQTYTGATNIQEGSLYLDVDNALSSQTLVNLNSTSNSLVLQNHAVSIGGLAGAGNVSLGAGSLTTGGNNQNIAFDGLISGTGSVTKTGAGSWTLNTAQNYTGLTTVSQGRLVQGGAQVLPTGSSVNIVGSGSLDLNSYALSLNGLTGTGAVVLGTGNLTLDIPVMQTNTFAGSISGAGSLYKVGDGILALSGQSGYTGDTYIQSGTLAIQYRQSLPDTTAVHMATGTVLSLAASDQTIESLSGTGTVHLGSNDLFLYGPGTSSFSGTISGDSSSELGFTHNSTGTLSGSLSMTGTVSIDATSSLILNSTLPAGNIVNNGALTLDTTANTLQIAIPISGTGSLTQTGINDITVTTNALAYTGTTSITGGNLTLHNTILSTASLAIDTQLQFYGLSSTDWTIAYPISGAGSVVYSPLSVQQIIMQGNLSYLGNTTVERGQVTYDDIFVTLGPSTISVDNSALFEANDSTIDLTGSSTLSQGLWHMSNSALTTTGATSDVVFTAAADSLSNQTGFWIESGGLTLNASDQNLILNANIYGTGSLTKTGTHDVTITPPNQVLYSGTTTVSNGGLFVNHNFNSNGNITLGALGTMHFAITNNNVKNILSNINGAGNFALDSGALQLSGATSYTGSTSVAQGATLSFGTNFTGTGAIHTNGDLNITVPEGQTYRLDNVFSGTGVVNKYGAGSLILGGQFADLLGILRIHNGSLQFTTLPPDTLNIDGEYTVVSSDAAVLSLSSDINPLVFGGTITGVSNTRFRLLGYKHHGTLTIRNFTLSGILDLAQRKLPTSDVVIPDAQFVLESMTVNDRCSINFQFDQADKSGIVRPFLSFDTAVLPNTTKYSLQAINQSDLFSNQPYRLIELLHPTQEQIDQLLRIANRITGPVVFTLDPSVVYDPDTDIIRLDMLITKKPAGSVVQYARKRVSLTIANLATQLQNQGVRNFIQAQNACDVIEYSQTEDELLQHINNFTPTGNKKKDQAISAPQTVSHAQSSMSSFGLQSLALHLNKKQGGQYKAPFAKHGWKPNSGQPSSINALNQKYIQQEDPSHDFSWAQLFDGLDIAGLSMSVESNYVHQRIKSQDIEPDTLINAWGTTLGSSKVIEQKYIVGVLASYLGRRIELAPNDQEKTSVTHERIRSLGLFTAYQDPDQPYYVSGFLSLGNHHYSATRTWQQPYFDSDEVANQNIPVGASSEHKGYDMTGNLEIGYTHIINQSMAVQPFIGAGFTYLYEPAYEEVSYNLNDEYYNLYGNKMFNSRIKKQTRSIGVQGIHSIVQEDAAYQFSSRLSYVTEKIQGDQSQFTYAYLYDPEYPLTLDKKNERQGAFEMSLGFNAAYSNQWIVSTNYVGHFGETLISHTVVATVQYSFA